MKTRVVIPGTFIAEYDDDDDEFSRIKRMVFMPLASHAGYFGVSALVLEGDESLDVEDVEGPFWRAVQAALAPTSFFPVSENFEDESEDRTTIAIEWEE